MICSNGLCDCVKTPLSGKETKSVVRRPTLAMGTLLGTPSPPAHLMTTALPSPRPLHTRLPGPSVQAGK